MHPNTELQLASQIQTTNDLLREIILSMQDLKNSCSTATTNFNRDVAEAPIFHFPFLLPDGGLQTGIQGKAYWIRLRPEIKEIRFEEKLSAHKLRCIEMQKELDHLIAHYKRIGGDESVIKCAELLKSELLVPVSMLEHDLAIVTPAVRRMAASMALVTFAKLRTRVSKFHESLYYQKHAFYFRDVKQWEDCLRTNVAKFNCFDHTEATPCLEYVCHDLLSELETAMARVSEELKTFREKALPTFLADEKERATTRYVHITTIATFFSSVTATTLQFSYAQLDSVLGGVVNLFWFLSLVFSVSSGVSSLLGMTWRKSSIYNAPLEPPKLIRLWLDKAPMVFLIVSAATFVIGLNLFAFLSLQPYYVAFATSILTGLHSACLFIVTAWFIYRLKYTSVWAQWIRDLIRWLAYLPEKLTFPYRWLIGRPHVMHIRRNVYWALEKDKRVTYLNYAIIQATNDEARFQTAPCLLAKRVRKLRVSTRKLWSKFMKSLLSFRRSIPTLVHWSPQEEHGQMDLEVGDPGPQTEIAEQEVTTSTSGEEAKSQYEEYLKSALHDGHLVFTVMDHVRLWETGSAVLCTDEWLEEHLGKILWGFPEFVKKFYVGVYPVLAPVRAQNRKEIEEGRNGGSPGHDGNVSSRVNDSGVPKVSTIVHDFFNAWAAVDAHARAKDASEDVDASAQAENASQAVKHPMPLRGSDLELEANASGAASDELDT